MIVEIPLELLWLPMTGIVEACAGMLWPSTDPEIHRLHRITLAVVSAGAMALLNGLVLLALRIGSWPCFLFAYLSFVGAGFLGNRIEKRCQRNR